MYLHGFHGTGVQEITDTAGVPKGSFYNYFESKETFTAEVVRLYAARLQEYAKTVLSEPISPVERIMKLYDGLLQYYKSDKKHVLQGCFAGNIGQEMTLAPIGDAVLMFFQEFRRPIKRCLDEAREQGLLSGDQDSQALADFITDSYQGALMRMKLEQSITPLSKFRKILESILV